jgi:dCTP deaminase
MSVLADRTIRDRFLSGELIIDPIPEDHCIQPASVDLHLATDFRSFVTPFAIDLNKVKQTMRTYVPLLNNDGTLALKPGGFVLGRTVERIEVPNDLVARVEGKSSLGRVGLSIHATAGYIDPGFRGTITLEITNDNNVPLVLHPGQSICQLAFETLTDKVERPYGHPNLKSKYQDQKDTTISHYER